MPSSHPLIAPHLRWIAIVAAGFTPVALAQSVVDGAPTPQPVVTLSATATRSMANDWMQAVFRAEAEGADAATAASEVNARMAKAIAGAKAVSGVDISTNGYTTYQVNDPDHPARWRVVQSLTLEASDFTSLAALATRLQSDDGLLLAGLDFSVSPAARRAAEDTLTQLAIRAWQQRAHAAAEGFGAGAYRTGRVTIQTSDYGRPPMLQAAGMTAAKAAPVAVEGGTSEVTVNVTGEAILYNLRSRR